MSERKAEDPSYGDRSTRRLERKLDSIVDPQEAESVFRELTRRYKKDLLKIAKRKAAEQRAATAGRQSKSPVDKLLGCFNTAIWLVIVVLALVIFFAIV